MAATHPTATRDGIVDYVVDQLDGGTVEYQTSGDAKVAACTFGTPAFGDSASGVATANAITDDLSAVGGTITKAQLKASGGTAIVNCSVTATGGGGDIELSSVVIGATERVATDALTYTGPA